MSVVFHNFSHHPCGLWFAHVKQFAVAVSRRRDSDGVPLIHVMGSTAIDRHCPVVKPQCILIRRLGVIEVRLDNLNSL